MMSIVALQKRARRLGEIRLGDKATNAKGDTYPIPLNQFRLTSAAKGLLDQAAELWGGEVTPWQTKWQVVTDTDELPVIVPPQDPDNVTWYELWSAGGLQRRCDGEFIVGKGELIPCQCDPENRECKMVTRLSLMLPDLPDVGVWTLSSTGYYAASEMAMSIQIVMAAAQETGMLPEATLAIDHREIKRPGDPLKKFVVPILRFADTLGSFIDVDGGVALPSEGSPRHLPVGDAVDGGEVDPVQHRSLTPATAHHSVSDIDVGPDGEIHPVLVGRDDDGVVVGTVVDDQGIRVTVDDLVEYDASDAKWSSATVDNPDAIVDAVVVTVGEDESVAEVIDHPAVDEAWSELLTILAEKPDDGSMGKVQDRTYRLYTFMHRAGLWGEHARQDALKRHHGHEHLTQLRKSELNEFAVKSFDAAKNTVAETDDDD